MLKAGLLPAPVIQPLRYDTIGTRIKVGPNTYIQIKSDVPGARIYFTTDGTKPDPFQVGRTGKASTHKYIGPFRLQLGNRVVRAIVSSRDRLRESPVATRYIDVLPNNKPLSDHEHDVNESSNSDDESDSSNKSRRNSIQFRRRSSSDYGEFQGTLDGAINPVNYSGTQINVWGFPNPELANFLPKPPQTQMGFLTENMIKNLNTPRPAAIEPPKNEWDKLPDNLKKFFKQILKLYERDTIFQNGLDRMIENGQIRDCEALENREAYKLSFYCPKFLIDEPIENKPKPRPKPKPRSPSPDIDIVDDLSNKKPQLPPAPFVPPPPPKVKPKPKPVTDLKEEIKPPKLEEPSTYKEELQQQGTVIDAPNFNAEKDAEALRKAVKGIGTDEQAIINICGNRSNQQRLQIKSVYTAMFGRSLVDDLKDDTSGNFKKLLVGLFMSPVEYDCMELRKAIQGLGTDDSTLIELVTSRSNNRLKEIANLYQELYKKKMEDDIKSDTSGSYRKLITSLLSFGRDENTEVDLNLARQDVDELIKAGIKKLGTDEQKFNQIFGTRSYAHLRQMFKIYQSESKKSIEESIKSEMSGNAAKTYLALINNIKNRPAYFAKEIKKAIKGLGTDEHTLNRIVISRCEVDMIQIKEEYQNIYDKSMENEIRDDVSGDYGKLLLLLIKDPSQRVFEDAVEEQPHVIEQVEEPLVEETPTVTDCPDFNSSNDCERLRKAMKGFGTDEKTIIEIISKRSRAQRQQLKTCFKSMFGRNLMDDLHSELSGSFRDVIEGLMMEEDEFDAFSFKKAIAGFGTDESALIELLTTRTPEQINAAKSKYHSMYKKNLENDIKSDTSGHFKKVLVSLLTASRPSGNLVDRTQAKIDSEELLNAGTKKWGTDESKFVTILCTRSFSQLRAMFDEYEQLTGHSIEEDLKKECSGDLLKVFLSIVACVRDKQAHFASILLKSMKGLGTKESSLIRVIVGRCEVDLVQIKQKFEQISKKSLAEFIKGDTSGDFRKVLLILIGDEDAIKK